MTDTDAHSDLETAHPPSGHDLTIPYSTELAVLGIRRTLIEIFAAGPYEDANLEHVVSQVEQDGLVR